MTAARLLETGEQPDNPLGFSGPVLVIEGGQRGQVVEDHHRRIVAADKVDDGVLLILVAEVGERRAGGLMVPRQNRQVVPRDI